MPDFLTVSEVADRLRISRQAVHKGIQCGRFPVVKVGNLYRISREWLDEYIKRGGDIVARNGDEGRNS